MSLHTRVFACTIALSLAGTVPAADAQSSLLPGDAKAVIHATQAQFIFPMDTTLPDGMWEIYWAPRKDGTDPYSIWISFKTPSSRGPTTISSLVKRAGVKVMINCITCDLAAFEDVAIDSSAFRVALEDHRLVLHVIGSKTVSHLFPVIPDTLSFSTGHPQDVVVNCGARLSAREYHRRCVVPPYVRPPNADSVAEANAPRRVRVLVSDFRDAKLLAHVPLVVRTTSSKPWAALSTDSLGLAVLVNPPLWSPLFVEAKCRSVYSAGSALISGTTTVQITPRMDTTVQLMTDPRVCER